VSENNSYEAITDFIMRSRESTYRLAFSYVHNKDDALDIIQESTYKALSSVRTLRDPAVLKTWFYRIVVNTALDFLRKHRNNVCLDVDRVEVLLPSRDDKYPDIDLRAALEHLSPANKTVIILRFFEGLKLEEIAGVLNENVSTTKTRLYSSLTKLRVELEVPQEEEEGAKT